MNDPFDLFPERPHVTHDFRASLALSEEYADAPWWDTVYRKAFPSYASSMLVRQDGWAQRGGIDRKVILASGKVYDIDQKVRAEDWPDFLLEYWSDRARKILGWVAKDLACDFIAYAFIPSQRCYLLPFAQLRRAWHDKGAEWIRRYRTVEAHNRGYVTVSVPVPIPTVMKALTDAMVVDW